MATILHVDMDAFFASVEQHDHPEWKGRAVIVGSGPHERGVVSTCSYEARRFGVHSAMPSRTAYAKCPHAIFVKPRMARYHEVSDIAFSVFNDFTPYVEAVSIDEAFLDISGSIHLYGCARKLGEELRRAVKERCGVTCSVGIASNRLLAKIGSEEHKPDGLAVMPDTPGEIADFLAPKPVSAIWGIGRKTAELLHAYGITTCGGLQKTAHEKLSRIVGSSDLAQKLTAHAFGISSSQVHHVPPDEKSVSREHTFPVDETDRMKIRNVLLDLVADVGERFRREERWARTAKLKLRSSSFETVTRQMPFARPVRDDFSMQRAALELFEREPASSVRLVGFGLADIVKNRGVHGPELFPDPAQERLDRLERLSETLDRLNRQGLKASRKIRR